MYRCHKVNFNGNIQSNQFWVLNINGCITTMKELKIKEHDLYNKSWLRCQWPQQATKQEKGKIKNPALTNWVWISTMHVLVLV